MKKIISLIAAFSLFIIPVALANQTHQVHAMDNSDIPEENFKLLIKKLC